MCIQSFLLNDIYSRIVPMIPFSKVHFHAHVLHGSNVSAVSLDLLGCFVPFRLSTSHSRTRNDFTKCTPLVAAVFRMKVTRSNSSLDLMD